MTTPPLHINGKISLCPMSIPVNLGCHEAHNYDLDNITQWVDKGGENQNGKLDCPTCRRELQPDQISYNTALAEEIHALALDKPAIFETVDLRKINDEKDLSASQIDEKIQGLKSLVTRKIQARQESHRRQENLEARVEALFNRIMHVGDNADSEAHDAAPAMRISIFGSISPSEESDNQLPRLGQRRGAIIQIGDNTIVFGYRRPNE